MNMKVVNKSDRNKSFVKPIRAYSNGFYSDSSSKHKLTAKNRALKWSDSKVVRKN